MRIEDVPADDPILERKIRDTIENEIKEGLLTEYAIKYPGGSYRFDIAKITSKSNFNLSGIICNEQGEAIRAFTIDNNFNLRLGITLIKKYNR